MQHHNWGMGMRTLKTALAIWLAFGVCDLLQFSNGTLAAITHHCSGAAFSERLHDNH